MDVIQDWFYRAFELEQLRFYLRLPLVLFIALPVILWVYILNNKKRVWRVSYPITSILKKLPQAKKVRLPSRHLPVILRILVLVFLILAALRPQMGKTREQITTEGIDIMLTLDISASMLAEDFVPTRLEAAKEVLAEFVRQNENDRLGLIVFSGMAFTQCPLTTDTGILEEFIMQVQIGDILQSGTAIGDAIVTATARFPDENVPTRLIILLTDGEHNVGEFDPETAARIANRVGVRIYTIGVGSREPTPIPDPNNPGMYLRNYSGDLEYTRIDEDTLREVASLTGGRYYRAEDEDALARIYQEIAQLETHEIESHRYTTYSEIFQYFLGIAMFLMLLELIAAHIWGRVIP